MPGWPVINTARTAGSAFAASSASAICPYIAPVIAFFFSGRAISIVATPLNVAVLMVMVFLAVGWWASPGESGAPVSSNAFEDARRALPQAREKQIHSLRRNAVNGVNAE